MKSATFRVLCAVPLWICAAGSLLADATIRYQSTINAGPSQPPKGKEALEKLMSSFGNFDLHMKNGKAWANAGSLISIMDYNTQQMTLIDNEHRTVATLPMSEYADMMGAIMSSSTRPELPKDMSEEAKKSMDKMMAGMKSHLESRKTGQVETIKGIQAEESEFVLTIEMPIPMGSPESTMKIRMVMRQWTAKPEESLRNQAVRELTAYNLYANHFLNPAGMLQKMNSTMPGIGDVMKSMTELASKNKTVNLRTRISMYTPMMPGGGGQDPTEPAFEMTQEAVEVTNAPVEESIFRIPAGYQAVPAKDLMKTHLDGLKAAMKVQ